MNTGENTKKIKCLQCGHEFIFTGASKDELGWHTSCPKCTGSFDVDIQDCLMMLPYAKSHP